MVLSLPDTCAKTACGSLYGILRYCCRTAGIKRTGDGIEIVVRTIHAAPAIQHLPAGPVVAHMLASDPLPAIPDGSGIGVQQIPGSVNRLFAIQHPAHAAVVEHPFLLLGMVDKAVFDRTGRIIEVIPMTIHRMLSMEHLTGNRIIADPLVLGRVVVEAMGHGTGMFVEMVPAGMCGIIVHQSFAVCHLAGDPVVIDPFAAV